MVAILDRQQNNNYSLIEQMENKVKTRFCLRQDLGENYGMQGSREAEKMRNITAFSAVSTHIRDKIVKQIN